MRSWGELGNLLAAKLLASALSEEMDATTVVIEAESLLPRLADIGGRIQELVSRHDAPEAIRSDYMELVRELTSVFPPNFELGCAPAPLRRELQAVSDY